MKGAAKLAGAIVLYLPALAFDLLTFCALDLLNAAFWMLVFSWTNLGITLFVGFVAFVLSVDWDAYEPMMTKRLEKWAGA